MKGLKSLLPLLERIEARNEVIEHALQVLSQMLHAFNVAFDLFSRLSKARSQIQVGALQLAELGFHVALELVEVFGWLARRHDKPGQPRHIFHKVWLLRRDVVRLPERGVLQLHVMHLLAVEFPSLFDLVDSAAACLLQRWLIQKHHFAL